MPKFFTGGGDFLSTVDHFPWGPHLPQLRPKVPAGGLVDNLLRRREFHAHAIEKRPAESGSQEGSPRHLVLLNCAWGLHGALAMLPEKVSLDFRFECLYVRQWCYLFFYQLHSIIPVGDEDKITCFEHFSWWTFLKYTSVKLVLKFCFSWTFYYENIQTEKLKELYSEHLNMQLSRVYNEHFVLLALLNTYPSFCYPSINPSYLTCFAFL